MCSLHDDEKLLVDEFYSTFQKFPPAPELPISEFSQYVFEQWVWAQKTKHMLRCVMCDAELFHYHQGDRRKSWELFLTRMKSIRGLWDSQFSKVPKLEADNPEFSLRWMDETNEMLTLCPAGDDQPYWTKMTTMYICRLLNLSPFSDFDTLQIRVPELSIGYPTEVLAQASRSDTSAFFEDSEAQVAHIVSELMPDRPYEIWQLVHMCSIFERSATYREDLWDALRQCEFEDLYVQMDGLFVRKDLKAKFAQSECFLVKDPADYVDFIPWEDLELCASHQESTMNAKTRFVHWIPRIAMKYDHHLHPNIATFRFCIENNYFLPGHFDQGKVQFSLWPLKDSEFIKELNAFWSSWNDCAITRESSTGELFLLQTIPGQELRQVLDSTNSFSAVQHFCRKIDRYRFESDKLLRDMMGPSFDPSYEGILDPIPIGQITAIDSTPLGQGERGIVYKATWSCPKRMDMPSAEDITVALKAIKVRNRSDIRRFFKELSTNVRALQRSSISYIRCLGISKTPKEQTQPNELAFTTGSRGLINSMPPETFLLVMEYAKFGPLPKYLLSTLKGDASDWPRIRDILVDLTVCISELHEIGIIHRDLHENNVLMGTNDTSMDEESLERPSLKVSDLGESTLSELIPQGGTYGDRTSWAPEVRQGRYYSKASDVYAMGSIMEKTVTLQWEASLVEQSIKTTMTPKFIVDVMKRCLRDEASQRPSAEEASEALGNHIMEDEFEMEEVDPEKVVEYEEETQAQDAGKVLKEIPP